MKICPNSDAQRTTTLDDTTWEENRAARLLKPLIAERDLRLSLAGRSSKQPSADRATPEKERKAPKKTQHTNTKDQSWFNTQLNEKEQPVKPSELAIVTMVGETEVKAYWQFSDYNVLAQLTLQSMMEYATHWGHPLFFLHGHLMLKSKQPYWAKIDLVEHYLSLGYRYVLYTDIDVLFLQMDTPLSSFIVPGKEVVSVNECVNRNENGPTIRSGFMLFHNSPATLEFLSTWRSSFEHYREIENPEQSALEVLSQVDEYSDLVHLHPWQHFHAYDTCHNFQSAFSMHFPGGHKVGRVARTLSWLRRHRPGLALHSDPPSQSLTRLFGGQSSVNQLADQITKRRLNLDNVEVQIFDAPRARVQSCLATLHASGHTAITAAAAAAAATASDHDDSSAHASYDGEWNKYVLRYDMVSFFLPIPTFIYFTVPDPNNLPPSVAANLEQWRAMNPGYDVVVYGDQDIEELARSFLDMEEDAWDTLTPVQKSDIWRYLVVFLFGGWYMDSDVECIRPISQWGHPFSSTLVVGIEAESVLAPSSSSSAKVAWGGRQVVVSQYAFGAAARHPALATVLRHILSQARMLSEVASMAMTPEARLYGVLETTGPWAFSDAVGEYICYADAYPLDMADKLNHLPNLAGGGHVVNTHVFGIAGFGAGQDHSLSPRVDDRTAPINVVHWFGGSIAFHGKRWTHISAAECETETCMESQRKAMERKAASLYDSQANKVQHINAMIKSIHNNGGDSQLEEQKEKKESLKMVIVGWQEVLVAPLRSAARAFGALGYEVSTIGSLTLEQHTVEELHGQLQDAHVLLWWNWRNPHSTAKLMDLRNVMPASQLWVLFNWDDPRSFFDELTRLIIDRVRVWDLVFTTGEAAIPYYLSLGAKEAHFLPPPVDLDLFYPDADDNNHDDNADNTHGGGGVVSERSRFKHCDVNFVLANLFSDTPTTTVNRTELILALAEAADRQLFRFELYGPESINIAPRHYQGALPYDQQRILYSTCRLTINVHSNDGHGGRHVNEKDLLVVASGGLLLVDAQTPGVLRHGEDCLVMESSKTSRIVQQVVRILRNQDHYATIRANGPAYVRNNFSQDRFAKAIDDRIRRRLTTTSHAGDAAGQVQIASPNLQIKRKE